MMDVFHLCGLVEHLCWSGLSGTSIPVKQGVTEMSRERCQDVLSEFRGGLSGGLLSEDLAPIYVLSIVSFRHVDLRRGIPMMYPCCVLTLQNYLD